MDDKIDNLQQKPEKKEKLTYENTVGMTGPLNISEDINRQEGPSFEETETNDDLSQITVQKDPPAFQEIGKYKAE